MSYHNKAGKHCNIWLQHIFLKNQLLSMFYILPKKMKRENKVNFNISLKNILLDF